jgi:hypothetical protein
MAPTEKLIADARQFLSGVFVKRIVSFRGMEEIFATSQSWNGYERAFQSWHHARWAWVDKETPAEVVSKVQALRQVDWSQIDSTPEETKEWKLEVYCQQYRAQRLIFLLYMKGREATNPDTYITHLPVMNVAARIGDDAIFQALAQQKQRKPTKDQGDRSLKGQLLLHWMSGCLWAFTNDGIAAFLHDLYSRPGGVAYHSQAISAAHRGLKLYHLPTPLYWGVTGSPPRLVPL